MKQETAARLILAFDLTSTTLYYTSSENRIEFPSSTFFVFNSYVLCCIERYANLLLDIII